jgi:hypothetical protein
LGSDFSTAFGGVRGSIFDGTRGSGGVGRGGFASVTSAFDKISGGVSGVTSEVVTGSGTGGGGATVTTSAGMKSAWGDARRSDPQKDDRLNSTVRCTSMEERNAFASGECVTVRSCALA